MLLQVTSSKNEKTRSWFCSRTKFLYWNDISYNSELFEKKVDMLNFVILDIHLGLSRYCLQLRNFWKRFLLLACFAVSKYAIFIWILGFQWLIQVHRCKYLQHCRRPYSVDINLTKNKLEVVEFGLLSLGESFENFSFWIFHPWNTAKTRRN